MKYVTGETHGKPIESVEEPNLRESLYSLYYLDFTTCIYLFKSESLKHDVLIPNTVCIPLHFMSSYLSCLAASRLFTAFPPHHLPHFSINSCVVFPQFHLAQ